MIFISAIHNQIMRLGQENGWLLLDQQEEGVDPVGEALRRVKADNEDIDRGIDRVDRVDREMGGERGRERNSSGSGSDTEREKGKEG